MSLARKKPIHFKEKEPAREAARLAVEGISWIDMAKRNLLLIRRCHPWMNKKPIAPKVTRKRGLSLWILLSLLVIFVVFACRFLFVHPAFDPDKVAHAETEMWQAYYAGNKTRLAANLVSLFRNQFGLSLPGVTRVGRLYAEAAMKFRGAQGSYDRIVLPDLIQAYAVLKRASDGSFDAEAAARAELAWWVARRTRGQNSAEQVGRKIAELYIVLYGHDDASLQTSGLLRAKAAALRDAGGNDADWTQVEALLQQSYRALRQTR